MTKIDFGHISPEDFEFLCEDIFRAKVFLIESRPSRGPDLGKDMIAVREFSDDMGILHKEKWLVECKHFGKSNRSVKEADIGNIEARMKVHGANCYLLISSTTVSETVKNQLKAISDDPSTNRKAIFWGKLDLIKLLENFPEIYKRYFWSWQDQAAEAIKLIQRHHPVAHRGAILWSHTITAIFENRANSGHALSQDKIGHFLNTKGITEVSYSASSDGETWVMLVQTSSAKELDDVVWSFYPPKDAYTIVQRRIAFDSIWQFHINPMLA